MSMWSISQDVASVLSSQYYTVCTIISQVVFLRINIFIVQLQCSRPVQHICLSKEDVFMYTIIQQF